jgi:hypothetical protein
MKTAKPTATAAKPAPAFSPKPSIKLRPANSTSPTPPPITPSHGPASGDDYKKPRAKSVAAKAVKSPAASRKNGVVAFK